MKKELILIYFVIIIIGFSCNSVDNVDKIINPDPENPNSCESCDSLLFQFSINTLGGEIVDEPKIASALTIIKDDSTYYAGNIGIEIRGESSQMFDKKSYGFETWDENYEDKDVSLIGFPEEEDWILYGPFSDKSLIRNKLIYSLSNLMGMYASKTEFCELTINNDYKGVYVFMEKLKRDKNRINIEKLTESDIDENLITGGYIIKIDKSDQEDGSYSDFNSFESKYDVFGDINGEKKIRFNYEYPKPEDIHANQKEYISNYIDLFEDALLSNNFKDPELGYNKYIDDDTFIDFFILNELSNNVDGYRLSTFLTKNRDEKLKIGPIWDFNLSFGNADYCGGDRYDLWAYKFNERCLGDYWNVPFWWDKLLEDENFVSKLKSRWNDLRTNILSNENILSLVNTDYSILKNETDAANRNFNRWQIFGIYIWPNSFIGNSYYEEINFLKDWISQRTAWLDISINEL